MRFRGSGPTGSVYLVVAMVVAGFALVPGAVGIVSPSSPAPGHSAAAVSPHPAGAPIAPPTTGATGISSSPSAPSSRAVGAAPAVPVGHEGSAGAVPGRAGPGAAASAPIGRSAGPAPGTSDVPPTVTSTTVDYCSACGPNFYVSDSAAISAGDLLLLLVTDSGQSGAGLSGSDINGGSSGASWTEVDGPQTIATGNVSYLFVGYHTTGSGPVTIAVNPTQVGGSGTHFYSETQVLMVVSNVNQADPSSFFSYFDQVSPTGPSTAASTFSAVQSRDSNETIFSLVSVLSGTNSLTVTTSGTKLGEIGDGTNTTSFAQSMAVPQAGTNSLSSGWSTPLPYIVWQLAVYGPIQAGSLTPGSPKIDNGQTIELTTHAVSAGTITFAWYSSALGTGACSVTGTRIPGTPSGGRSYNATPTGDEYYCYVATNSLGAVANSGWDLVTVSPALTPATTPVPTATKLDVDQSLAVVSTIGPNGSAPYAYQWLVSVNAGSYASATMCAVSSGAGASANTVESCAIASLTLTAADTYAFELRVTDSANAPVSVTSSPSATVTVASALSASAAPTSSATQVDVDQAITVSASLPTSGTAPYGWLWLTSVNGGPFASGAYCGTPGGSGGSAGAPVTCDVASHSFTAGASYAFALQVTDSASTAETATSGASATIYTNSTLLAPNAPTVSATNLDADQSFSASTGLGASGTAPYSWQWYVSVNSGGFVPTAACSTNSGTGGVAFQVVTCSIAPNALSPGDTYQFEVVLTDNATVAESATSTVSSSVAVSSALTAPSAPTLTASSLDTNQMFWANSTLPSTGSLPYSWVFWVKVNGATAVNASGLCTAYRGSGGSAGLPVSCQIVGGTLTAGSTYAFFLQVVDGATSAEAAQSSISTTVSVSAPPVAAPITPGGSPGIDSGQSIQLQGAASGGTGALAVAWYTASYPGTPPACSAGTPTGIATSGYLASPSSTIYFCYTVTDSASTPDVVASTWRLVTVNPTLAAGSPASPQSYVGIGSTEVVSAASSGGSATYSYDWHSSSSNSGTCAAGSLVQSGPDASYPARPAQTAFYCYVVTDSSAGTTGPESAASPWLSLTVIYQLEFGETGLTGEHWSLVVSGPDQANFTSPATLGGSGTTLQLWLAAGGYTYTIGTVPGWLLQPANYSGSLTVASSNQTISLRFVQVTYGVEFSAAGLPAGVGWGITVNGTHRSSAGPGTITFQVPNGTFTYTISDVAGWHQTTVPYTQQTAIQTSTGFTLALTFAQVTYSVTFSETGLASGVGWSVTINGTLESATAPSSVTTNLPNGTFTYTISDVAGWHQTTVPYPQQTANQTSSGFTLALTFAQETYSVTFSETGLASGVGWSVTINGTLESATAPSSVTTNLPNGTFTYTISDVAGWHQTTVPYPQQTANQTSSGFTLALTFAQETYSVTFSETGLASGVGWSVTINGTLESATAPSSVTTNLPNGTFTYTISDVAGWHQTTVPYPQQTANQTSSGFTLALTFAQETYSVTFSETGLASGVGWSVTINGTLESATAPSSVTASLPNGTSTYSVGAVVGYSASPSSGSVTVRGAAARQSITFTSRAPATYAVTFSETGLPSGMSWAVLFNGTRYAAVAPAALVVPGLANGTYSYSTAVPGYIATPSSGTASIRGASVSLAIRYVLPTPGSYRVEFTESGVPAGTSWSMTIGTETISTVGSDLSFQLGNGSYRWTAGAAGGYLAYPLQNGTVLVAGLDVVVALTYQYTFSVSFSQSSIPNGTVWTVQVTAQSNPSGHLEVMVGPTSWFANATGTTSPVFHLINGTYTYTISAPGYQTTTGALTVAAAPVSQSVTLSPNPSSGLAWWIWVIIGVVIAAVVVAVVVLRMRRGKGGAQPPQTPASGPTTATQGEGAGSTPPAPSQRKPPSGV